MAHESDLDLGTLLLEEEQARAELRIVIKLADGAQSELARAFGDYLDGVESLLDRLRQNAEKRIESAKHT